MEKDYETGYVCPVNVWPGHGNLNLNKPLGFNLGNPQHFRDGGNPLLDL